MWRASPRVSRPPDYRGAADRGAGRASARGAHRGTADPRRLRPGAIRL